ncbi:MAG TPA: SdrD B-like domain-containing protein [Bacteroidota bacterium]|nr:SdrD B-like domain-containing protein [Bacteroidota bacterium]
MSTKSLLNCCRFGLLVIAMCLASSLLFSQTVKYRIPITVTDSGKVIFSQRLDAGLHPNATLCLDTATLTGFTDRWGEFDSSTVRELEGPPPSPATDIRFTSSCNPQPYLQDIRHFTDTNQVDTLKFKVTLDNTHGEDTVAVKFRWPHVLSEYADSVILVKSTGAERFRINMAAQDSFSVRHSIALNGTSFGTTFIIIKGPKVPPPAPAPVVTIFPSMGQQSVPQSLTFTWNSVPQAFFYKFQLATDSLFTSIVSSSSPTGTSVTVNNLQQNKTHYWRVLVSTPYGFSYYQQPVLRFTTILPVPGVPPLVAPADGAIDIPTSGTTLQWGAAASSSPVTYQVQLSSDQNFLSHIVAEDSTLSGLTFPTPALSNCVTYYWRVRGKNSAGPGPYSATRTFRTVLAGTSAPVLLSPPNGATGVDTSPMLIWAGDSCATLFTVQVSRDSAFSMIVINQVSAAPSLLVGPLGSDSVYYWRVNSMNTVDTSAYSTVDSFKTKHTALDIPLLIAPANGDTLVPSSTTMLWHRVNFATRYHLQIAKNPSFLTPIVNDSTLTDTSKQGNFINCIRYYWRVRALNDSGSGGFSGAANFGVLHIPDAPIITSPLNGSQGNPLHTTLGWKSDNCARAFRVQLSNDRQFSQLRIDQTVIGTNSFFIPTLDSDTEYYCRIKAINSLDSSLFSAVDSFHTTGTISGTIWNDLNFNGIKDSTEPGLGGWTIEVRANSCAGALITSDITDGSGRYTIEAPPGPYGVSEVLKPGYGQSYPEGNCTSVSLFHNVTNVNFGNYKYGSISGTTYRDANDNGVRDSAETVFDGFVVRLLADSANGYASDSVVSASGGSFSFADLPPGTYNLTERPAAGWTISQPSGGTYVIPLLPGMDLTGKDLGNFYLGDDSTYRTWTYAQLSADSEKRPLRAPRPGKTIHVPNSANLLVGLMRQDTVRLPVGLVNIPIPGTRKFKCYLYPRSQGNVFTTFNTRGIKHGLANPGPIDFNNTFRRLYGKKSTLTARVHDNILMAELLTLKINLAASAKQRTNPGLGGLEYYASNRIQGRPLMTVQEISDYGDSIMTNWETVNPAAYQQLYNIVHAINGAFTTPTTGDTTANGGWFTGGGRLKWISAVKVQSTSILQQPKQGVHNHPRILPEPLADIPDIYELAQNYPNPFNPATTVRFTLPMQSLVTLKVYNVLGQEVTTLYNNELIDAGEEEIEFDGTHLASGVYFYRLTATGIDDESGQSFGEKFMSVKKMLLMK